MMKGMNLFVVCALSAVVSIGSAEGKKDLRGIVPELPFDFEASYAEMRVDAWMGEGTCPSVKAEQWPEACKQFREKAKKNYVDSARHLGEMNELAWKCNTALTHTRGPWDKDTTCFANFEALAVVPMVHCETEDLYGYDLGLNLGEYGMEIKDAGIWGNWPEDQRKKIVGKGFLYSIPLSTKTLYQSAMRSFMNDDDIPSQEVRCAEVLKHGKPYETFEVEAKQPDGRGIKQTLQGVRTLKTRRIYATTMVKAPELNLDSETNFVVTMRMSREGSKSIYRIPKEQFQFPYKHIVVTSAGRPGCKDTAPACQRIPKFAEVDSSEKLYEFINDAEDCYSQSIDIAEGAQYANCAPHYKIRVVLPMISCNPPQKSVGFDFGINLGDFGLRIANSMMYMNAPRDEVRKFHGAATKTIALAKRTPNKHDFNYFEPNQQQRCKIMMSYGIQNNWSQLVDTHFVEWNNLRLFPVQPYEHTNPRNWLNGTTEFFNHGIDFPLDNSYVAVFLEREPNTVRSVEPDVRRFNKK